MAAWLSLTNCVIGALWLQPDSAVEEHAKRLGVKIMTYKVRDHDLQGERS